MKNKELWRTARLALCSQIRRIINKHNESLVSLRVTYDGGVKSIDLTPDQTRRVLTMISNETEVI